MEGDESNSVAPDNAEDQSDKKAEMVEEKPVESPQVKSKSDLNKQKVDIFLKPTGNVPIMKQKKWSVEPDKKIWMIAEFIRKYLKLDPSEPLFIYVNQAFAPAPDQLIKNLYECFETDGKLVLHYCSTQAWG